MSARPERIPITLLTGFLGSGKTTLVNALLRHPGLADTAVIVNEFGAIALDHQLIAAADDNIVLLGAGCLCCAAQGGLRETLADLFVRRVNGAVPKFRRVLIETSGLADPGPIANVLAFDSLIRAEYQLHTIVTAVDALNAEAQLDQYAEALQQALLADVLVITKGDCVADAALGTLRARLAALNPTAACLSATRGAIDPDRILQVAPRTRRGPKWLSTLPEVAARTDTPPAQATASPSTPATYLGARQLAIPVAHHTAGVRSLAVTLDHPVTWAGLAAWMALAAEAFGRDLLRVKGLLGIDGQPGPVIVHAVAGQFHAPETLPAWPDADHRSRLVIITRNVAPERLRTSLKALALPAGAMRPASIEALESLPPEPTHAM